MVFRSYAAGSSSVESGLPIGSIRFGTCEILPRTREILVNGASCPVEPKVFDLILYLIQERHRVISKDELLDRIWKGTIVSDSVVARTIMKARKAIAPHMPECPFIKTVHCVGYRFAAAAEIRYDDGLPPAGIAPLEYAAPAPRTWSPPAESPDDPIVAVDAHPVVA